MLRAFGASRFRAALRRLGHTIGHYGVELQVAEAADAWHLLETQARVGANRAGKRYKDWLFERADRTGDGWTAAVEAGASLLMRDVVRETLRRNYAPAFMTSLQRPIAGDDVQPSALEDLLPDPVDPCDALSEREWRALADQHAAAVYPGLSSRQRIAMWGRSQGLALDDPRLLDWTQSSKSLLYKQYLVGVKFVASHIARSHPDEPAAAQRHMALYTLAALEKILSEKIFVEKRATRFLKKI